MTQTYPMEFTMRIDMSNAAFDDEEATELRRIMQEVSNQLANGTPAGPCTDINGNTVGGFVITFPEEEEE